VDRDLRTLLRERADDVRPSPSIPPDLLRRSRRRRLMTAGTAGIVTVALIAGGVAVTRLAMRSVAGPAPLVTPGAGAAPDVYPFIYPSSQAELKTITDEVAQGSMPMWTDPEGVAVLFAVNVMGWEMEDVEASVRGDDPITAVISNPRLSEAAGSGVDIRTTVYLMPVPRTDDPSMYAVLAAQADGLELEPIGPDEEFGRGPRIGFRGSLGFIPQGAQVTLTVDGGAPRSVPAPDGVFQVETEAPRPPGWSTLISVAVQDGAGNTLAMFSSRIGTWVLPVQAESGASEPELATPPPVAQTREAILDAATARDFDALRALIPDEGFTFSYGGETDPIRYWKRLESEGHVPVIGDILPSVLGTEPGFEGGIFVWPAQAIENPAQWDEADVEALTAIYAEEDIRQFQEIGLYTGWRVGIDRDGTWVFYVAGD
jgi:hypothetical protein